MFHRALICTDFSDGLHRLVNFVPSLATGGLKQITFLHSVPLEGREIPRLDDDDLKDAQHRFAPALENVPAGVDVKVEVQWGKPTDRILSTAKSHQSDVVLLGMPIRSLLNEKLFGSTTMGICQRMTTPLLILRPQLISTYTVEELDLRCRHLFRYLLLPYDGSTASDYLVQRVKQYAQNRPADSLEQCLLCWVIEDVSRRGLSRQPLAQQAEEKLAAVKTELESVGLKVETQVLHGNPITEIMTAALEYDISAIATSSNSLGKLIELSIPSFTGELLRRSWHPVLYFPPSGK